MMKTNSVVRPRETQRIVLNLEPEEVGARVEIGMIRFSMVRRGEVRHEGGGGERRSRFHPPQERDDLIILQPGETRSLFF